MSRYIYGETPYDTDGPYEEWHGAGARLTDAMRNDFSDALREERLPFCPGCREPVETVEQESVAVQQYLHDDYKQVGTLTTLSPCGHRFSA